MASRVAGLQDLVMHDTPPPDLADHAQDFARRWGDRLEEYVAVRNEELGIPEGMNGQPNFEGDGRWRAFNPYGIQGGENTTGVVVDSGVFNPELLKGRKGARLWAKARLRDRIDSIISHEYEELRHGGDHAAAIEAAAKTELPITDMARRINRARAR
jgi:hypothetical protein